MHFIDNKGKINLRKRKLFISFLRDLQDKVEKSFPSLKLDQSFLNQSNFFIKTLTWGLIASTGFAITWLTFAYTDEVVLVGGKLEPIGDVKTYKFQWEVLLKRS